jgi:hypothetical protein
VRASARRLFPVLIGVLSFVVFIPALGGQFLTWDHNVNLLSNKSYRGLGWPQIRWHYIPLTWLSFSGNYVAGDMDPRGYHLVNLILHAANAVIFYLVGRRLLAVARDGGRQDAAATPS